MTGGISNIKMNERPGGMQEDEVEDAVFSAAKQIFLIVALTVAASVTVSFICKKHSDNQVPARDAIKLCAETTSGEVERILECARDIVLPKIEAGELRRSTYVPTEGMVKEVLAEQ